MNTKIPYVFISSTVAEFRDLRSAISYTLQGQGFNVYKSEAANFEVKGDRSALEECFTNIRNSDYYILIIGNSLGSFFEKDVSVTRQEYRVAKESFLSQGNPRLLLHIREATMNVISNKGQDSVSVEIENKDHLTSFVSEVQSPDNERVPNYLTRFRDFEDIMNSLSINMNLGRTLSEKLARHSLLSELLSNLTNIVGGKNPVLYPYHWYMESVKKEIQLKPDDIYGEIHLTEQQGIRLGMSLIGKPESEGLHTKCIKDAIDEGVFLRFDTDTGGFEETSEHKLLNELFADISALRKKDIPTATGKWSENIINEIYKYTHKQISVLVVQGIDLAYAFSNYDITENIFQGHLALCKLLLGISKVLPEYSRQPLTPFGDEMDAALQEEHVSKTHITTLIEKNIHPFGEIYSAVHFGKNREETVKHLSEIFLKGQKERGPDLSSLKGVEEIFKNIADSLVDE